MEKKRKQTVDIGLRLKEREIEREAHVGLHASLLAVVVSLYKLQILLKPKL